MTKFEDPFRSARLRLAQTYRSARQHDRKMAALLRRRIKQAQQQLFTEMGLI